MRVYQLNTFSGVKSTGRIAFEIAKLAESQGMECRVGYGVPGVPREAETLSIRIGRPWERKLHGALRKLMDGEGYGSYFATRRFLKEMRAFHPDVVHLHNLHGCYLHLPTLFGALKRMGVPVLWTLHDCWPFTGHCAYYDLCGCDRFETECHHCPQKHAYPECIGLSRAGANHRAKKRWLTALPNLTFVAPCEWMKRQVERSFMKGAPVRVIPNGVDLTTFHPMEAEAVELRRKYGLENAQVLLAVASEWDARKGLKDLLLCREHWDQSCRLVIIGLSGEQIAALPKGVLGLTHTESPQELAAWYTAADCLVNPTMEDNLPMVNLEAIACGTPVAVYHTGGCGDEVDETCGRVVSRGDALALARAAATLCGEKPRLREGCLRRAEGFEAGKMFQAYVDLYREVAP